MLTEQSKQKLKRHFILFGDVYYNNVYISRHHEKLIYYTVNNPKYKFSISKEILDQHVNLVRELINFKKNPELTISGSLEYSYSTNINFKIYNEIKETKSYTITESNIDKILAIFEKDFLNLLETKFLIEDKNIYFFNVEQYSLIIDKKRDGHEIKVKEKIPKQYSYSY